MPVLHNLLADDIIFYMKKLLVFSILLVSAVISAVHAESIIESKVGKNVQVRLVSNPTTGYSWKIDSVSPKDVVRLIGSRYEPSEKKLTGSGGVEVWTFRAVKKGVAQVRFIYQRPWEKEIPPIEARAIKIKVYDEKTKK